MIFRLVLPLALLVLPACGQEKETKVEKEEVAPKPDDAVPEAKSTKKTSALPLLTFTKEKIELDGKLVGSVTAFEKTKRLAKVDELFETMKGLRKAFREEHPGTPFPGAFLMRGDASVTMLAVKSAYQTAAYAGFPNPSIEVGGKRILASAEIPAMPDAEPKKPEGPVLSVVVGKETVRLMTRVDGVDAANIETPEGGLLEAVKARFDAKPIDRVVLYVPNDSTFGRFGKILGVLAEATGNDGTPPIVISVADERPTPLDGGEDGKAGRLPPDVIQRIVRKNFSKFRHCYEQALLKNPKLEGRVVVKFVIGLDGKVSSVSAGGDIPDATVPSCVGKHFHDLVFPKPEGGIVTVSYPIVFSPS